MQSEYKDHYQTLGLAPGATAEQIKKAFRKLALDLHPDKTGNDPGLSVRFSEIQRAYEVLSDPLQKIQFLQERWLRKAQGQNTTVATGDLAGWIKECLALEKNTTTQAPDRIDQQSLHHQIAKLASQEKIDSLKDYAHPEALLTGARLLLQAAAILPYELFMNNARQLATIEANQTSWQQEIRRAIQQKSNERNWKRYRVAAIVVITLLLCLLIAS